MLLSAGKKGEGAEIFPGEKRQRKKSMVQGKRQQEMRSAGRKNVVHFCCRILYDDAGIKRRPIPASYFYERTENLHDCKAVF